MGERHPLLYNGGKKGYIKEREASIGYSSCPARRKKTPYALLMKEEAANQGRGKEKISYFSFDWGGKKEREQVIIAVRGKERKMDRR